MSMPFYVAPEQWMKDKADFARKGIARGRALCALLYDGGILICAENSSTTLRKVSEIYDRIAFAGAGRYNEYDRLRISGVRHADLKGYSFSREDVDAQSLANAYAQMIGDVFTHEVKPMEVEILVAEVGDTASDDRLFHILYDGTVVDETGFTVLGGESDTISDRLKASYQAGLSLADGLRCAVKALGGDRTLSGSELEVAVLERAAARRAFRRLRRSQVDEALEASSDEASSGDGEAGDGKAGASPTGKGTKGGKGAKGGTGKGQATKAGDTSPAPTPEEGDAGD